MLPSELVDFVEAGVSILVGTRDGDNRPEVIRGVGARVSKDRTALTLYIHEEWGARALANIRANGHVAVGFSRPVDHTSIQVKGKATTIVPSTESDRSVPERYHVAVTEQLYMVGIPRSIVMRMRAWPAAAVTVSIDDVFVQTPGPDAGKRFA